MKKIIAFALAVLVFSSALTVANADETETLTTTAVSETEVPVTEETTTETTEESTTEAPSTEPVNGDVAKISICSRAGGFPAFFHVWIYIENISSQTLKVGAYDLPAGEGVSMGTWALAVADGWGVYYNVEAYACADKNRNADDYYSLTKTLDAQELEKVSKEVSRFNWWDPIFNCTVFAYRVWNAAGGKWLLPVPLPWVTVIEMAVYGAKIGELEMYAPEEARVYRQRGWGDNARLEETSKLTRNSLVASFNGEKESEVV